MDIKEIQNKCTFTRELSRITANYKKMSLKELTTEEQQLTAIKDRLDLEQQKQVNNLIELLAIEKMRR